MNLLRNEKFKIFLNETKNSALNTIYTVKGGAVLKSRDLVSFTRLKDAAKEYQKRIEAAECADYTEQKLQKVEHILRTLPKMDKDTFHAVKGELLDLMRTTCRDRNKEQKSKLQAWRQVEYLEEIYDTVADLEEI